MVSAETRSVVERAKRIYGERLRADLEADHRDRFVAIEPESGEHFLADTLDGAVEAAQDRYPSRLTHVVRIGHPAALHLGGWGRDRPRGRATAGAAPGVNGLTTVP